MEAHPPALQLYTVREELAGDRRGALARIAAFGYAAVEPFNVLDDPAGLRADLDAAGLAVCSMHAMPAGEQAGGGAPGRRHAGHRYRDRPVPAARQVRGPRASVLAVAAELNEIGAPQAADQGFPDRLP